MEHRSLGRSGLKVPVLCLGTATFGGKGEFFKAWGNTGVPEARRLVDICLEAGLTMFDSADGYSEGLAEEVLGAAIEGRRDEVLVSTKATFATGPGPNEVGSSRYHLQRAVEGSLRRLKTDRIDLFQLHAFDAMTPPEETLRTLDDLVRSGKVLYVGCSNFSGWHLMKSLAVSDRHGLVRFVAHQAYYSLVGRDYEWDLMPLALDQGVGTVVWSPLGWARLTGKIRRGAPVPAVSRLHVTKGPPVPDDYLYRVVDALDSVARETGKTVPQVAINWLLRRPTVSTVIIGARNEEQLRDNLGSVVEPHGGARLAPGCGERARVAIPLLAPEGLREESVPDAPLAEHFTRDARAEVVADVRRPRQSRTRSSRCSLSVQNQNPFWSAVTMTRTRRCG